VTHALLFPSIGRLAPEEHESVLQWSWQAAFIIHQNWLEPDAAELAKLLGCGIIGLGPRDGMDWILSPHIVLRGAIRTGHYRMLSDPKRYLVGFVPCANVADFFMKPIDDQCYSQQRAAITWPNG
jgi:hypothetical protein